MRAVTIQVPVPPIVNLTNSSNKPSTRRLKRLHKTNLHTNAWRLIDSKFPTINNLFSFSLEACCDPKGCNKHGLLPLYSEKVYFLTRVIAGQYVYCNPPWSFAVQCVEHIRTCHAKSSMNTKDVIVLPD
jgi:hypothetical protein